MRFRSALLALASLLSAPAFAQNFAINGDFDSDLTRWSPDFGLGTWSSVDWEATSTSGSALVTNNAASAGAFTRLQECITVGPGTYHAAVLVRVPTGQSRTGSQGIGATFFSGASCTGTALGNLSNSATFTPSATFFPFVLSNLVAPAGTVSARLFLQVSKVEAGGTLQAYFDHVYFVLTQTETLTIPASASIHGVNGAFFQTDLWVVNNSTLLQAVVTAQHRCGPGQTCAAGTKTFTVPRGSGLLYTDVIGKLFGDPETSGAIELTHDAALVTLTAGSRTYSPSLPAPTTGTAVPAFRARGATRRALLYGASGNGGDTSSGFRTNVGAYNPRDFGGSVHFELHAANGDLLGEVTQAIGPHATIQNNDIFAVLGKGSIVTRNAYVVVTSTVDVFPFMTVIDNQSQDSVFIPAETDFPGF